MGRCASGGARARSLGRMARPATGHAETRTRIVAIARRHIAERGVARLELAPVAEEAGLTAPTLYHYVDNRRGLVLAALGAEVADLLRAVLDDDDRDAPPADRLAAFLDRQVAWLTAASPHTVAFLLDAVLESREADDLAEVVGPVFGRAESVFEDVARATSHRRRRRDSDAGVDVARTLLAGVYLMRALGQDIEVDAVLRSITEALGSYSK